MRSCVTVTHSSFYHRIAVILLEVQFKRNDETIQKTMDDDNGYWLTGYLVHIMAKNIPCNMIGVSHPSSEFWSVPKMLPVLLHSIIL